MNRYEVRPVARVRPGHPPGSARPMQAFEIVQISSVTGTETPVAAYAGPVSANLVAAALNETRCAEVELSS